LGSLNYILTKYLAYWGVIMENELQKKYGLITAIAMVIGIVIGSGVFFKAEKVLVATGGDLPQGILAWGIGGVIMIVCAYVFAIMATRYEKVNGVVDYAEAALGVKYGYFVGWFHSLLQGAYDSAKTDVMMLVNSAFDGTFPVTFTFPFITSPGVIITPALAISLKSVTFSIFASMAISFTTSRTDFSKVLHLAQPAPRTLIFKVSPPYL
jgi:amino acid transporter